MKHSNTIGTAAGMAIILLCFAPWVYIASINTTITGFELVGTNFGKPGLVQSLLSAVAILLFMISRSWAKKTNVFVGTCNFAWAIRNYLFVSACEMGECPEKKWGLYGLLFFSLVLIVMALLPKIKMTAIA